MTMRTTPVLPVLLTLLLGGLSVCAAQAPAEFTPPGPNIALHKPYTLDPCPTYGDCADAADRTQLTDGEYTKGYFWVQKTTVGWVHSRPVIVTIDLGQVEPIAGLSYSTAAGVADVAWPLSILVMVSDDGQQWTVLGDLIALSNKRGAPPPTPYRLHRFATGDLQARGRYVALVVDCAPYTVVDEIEIYRGQEAWLNQPPQGRTFKMSPKDYHRTRQVANSVQGRMHTDLDDILGGLDSTQLSAAEKAGLRARAAKLGPAIDAWDEVPEDFTTVLPLNDLHTRVYALHAPVLRARGYRALTAWGGYRYDMLQPLQAPAKPPAEPPALSVRMMRNEHRAEVLNLTNPTDGPLTATVRASGLGRYASALTLREVLFTDTRERTPVAAAILPGQPADKGLQVTIPAGLTRQVWLHFNTRDLPAGDVRATLEVTSGSAGEGVTLPLSLHVADLVMPAEFSVAIGGWDETNNKGGYQVTAENMRPLIENLRDHGVNMPWSNPQVMPTPGQYDAAGNMTAAPDFTSWDEWVDRWQGAPYWGLFPNVGKAFAGEPMGTPRFNKMVGAWATAWVQHAAAQGIKPGQIMLLLVDEPQRDEQDQIIIAWAKALHAAQPELVVWNDPIHAEPAKVDPEFYAHSNVLCPNTPRFLQLGEALPGLHGGSAAGRARAVVLLLHRPEQAARPGLVLSRAVLAEPQVRRQRLLLLGLRRRGGQLVECLRAAALLLFAALPEQDNRHGRQADGGDSRGGRGLRVFHDAAGARGGVGAQGRVEQARGRGEDVAGSRAGAGGGDHGRGQDAVDGPQGPHRHGPRPAAGPRPVGEAEQAVESGAPGARQWPVPHTTSHQQGRPAKPGRPRNLSLNSMRCLAPAGPMCWSRCAVKGLLFQRVKVLSRQRSSRPGQRRLSVRNRRAMCHRYRFSPRASRRTSPRPLAACPAARASRCPWSR